MIERLFSIESWRKMFTRYGRQLGWGLAIIFGIPLVIGFGWSQYAGRGVNGPGSPAQAEPIVLVNGETITAQQFAQVARQASGVPPGEEFARVQGAILYRLITNAVVQQEAKKRNVRASEADIDRTMLEERERSLGKNATDSQWEDRIMQEYHLSPAEYREEIGKQLSPLALLSDFKNAEKVTEEDARKQNSEAKLTFVLIPTQGASPIPPPKGAKPLPDAEAKKKAEDLLAQVKAGADIAAIARANSGDSTAKQGGDLGWRPEFRSSMGGTMFGAIGYGKDFDEAVQKAPTGQLTEVVRAAGFANGYAFAKVHERRNNPPREFDAKKATETLRDQRATEKLSELILAKVKEAKIEFKDPEKKAYYDLFKVSQMRQEQMMAQFGQGDPKTAPTAEDVAKQEKLVEAEFEDLLKRNPTDATAALVVAGIIRPRLVSDPTQAGPIRDRLINLYETALRTTENRDLRFQLAEHYREKKQPEQAEKHYAQIVKLLAADPPYDMQTMTDAVRNYDKLISGLKSVNKPAEAAKAEESKTKIVAQLAEEKRKQDEEKKRQEAERLKQAQEQKNKPPIQPGTGTGLPKPPPGERPANSPAGGDTSRSAPPSSGAPGAPAPPTR